MEMSVSKRNVVGYMECVWVESLYNVMIWRTDQWAVVGSGKQILCKHDLE
jgi:hypothetical protein